MCMRVHNKFEFDDRQLRQIAQEGLGKRSGKAKRSEVRTWLNKLVSSTLQTMSEPKVRRRREKPDVAPHTRPAALDLEDPCGAEGCGKRKGDHVGLTLACPLSRKVKPGSKFKAVQP